MVKYPKIEVIAFPYRDQFQSIQVVFIVEGVEDDELLPTRLNPMLSNEEPSPERFESKVELRKLKLD